MVIYGERDATYIQSPNRKFAFGFGGLLDSTKGPDGWDIGVTRSWSGESLEGGGREMTGEFISRENGDRGEKEGGGWVGRILGVMNRRLRANAYAPAAVGGE